MEECIFCSIVSGKIPANKVYEDAEYVAIMDIFPRTKGHTLVIPKTHYRWTYDVPDFGRYWEVARIVGRAIQDHMACAYISYLTVGEEVPHAHIHVLPQDGSSLTGIKFQPIVDMTQDDIAALAADVRKKLLE